MNTTTDSRENTSWRCGVRRVTPYVPGEQPRQKDIIKINTNENPYPPAPGVAEVLTRYESGDLRRYPDPEIGDLSKALADYYGVDPKQVFVGVGSDDVLAMSFLTFFNSGRPILFPDITYSFYDVWADLYGIPYETIPLDPDFKIRPGDYVGKGNGGIIIANPNAPTGDFLPLSGIEQIVSSNPDSVVIVDEAYVDFGGASALPLLQKYDNLLIVQTFSKSRSMAGMRIGFAIGNEEMIRYLQDVKYSFNSYTLSAPAIAAGTAAVKDAAYFKETCAKIVQTREWFKGELTKLGFSFPDSKANFVFAEHPLVPAKKIFDAMRRAGIYVRYFNKPRISEHLRISIGSDEQMQRVVDFLRDFLERETPEE